MSRRFTCPFCFQTCRMNEVLYVCPSCDQPSQPGFLEREPIKCKTPGCSGFATWRQCPACGSDIPKMLLETPDLPISIVGACGSGKTAYTTVMLKELTSHTELGLALSPATRETKEKQNDNVWSIYSHHTVPEATIYGSTEPQIWTIRNSKKRRRNRIPTDALTIYDKSGEDDWNVLGPTSAPFSYISASKAIILVIDPLVLPAVRRGGMVDGNVLKNSCFGGEREGKDPVDLIAGLAKLFNAHSPKRVDIPVAVVITKLDTIPEHESFGPQAIIRKNSLPIRDGQVDLAELRQVDSEMRDWLKQIGEDRIIAALDMNFTDYHFFGVSSFGAPPKDFGTLEEEIKPLRVLDPILWLFRKKDIID